MIARQKQPKYKRISMHRMKHRPWRRQSWAMSFYKQTHVSHLPHALNQTSQSKQRCNGNRRVDGKATRTKQPHQVQHLNSSDNSIDGAQVLEKCARNI